MRYASKLLVGVAGSVLGLAVASQAAAQAAMTPGASVLDEVVVTGVRLQNQRSISVKKDAAQVVDSINQDEAGRQPDFNVGDALRRAPGVSTVPEEDEGQFVSIRGINPDLTFTAFDGGSVATSTEGALRRVSVEFFPASVVKRLDVIKTRTPDIDGNAIGGEVNMVSRSAYDSPGLFAHLSTMVGKFDGDGAPYGLNDSSGKNGLSVRSDAIVSNTFGAQEQIGVVFAVNYIHKDKDEERILPISFSVPAGASGDGSGGTYAPNNTTYSTYHNPQDRYSVFGKLEYKPNDALYMSLQGNIFYQEDFARRESEVISGGTPNFATPTAGSVTRATGAVNADTFRAKNTQLGAQYYARYDVSDDTRLDLRASFSQGEFFQDSPTISFATTGVNYDYAFVGGAPFLTITNSALYGNPANFRLATIAPFTDDYDTSTKEIEANVDRGFGGEGGWGVKAGVKARRSWQDHTRFQTRYTYGGTAVNLSNFVGATDYTPLYRPGTGGYFVNQHDVMAYLDANAGAFTATRVGAGNDYVVTEDVSAAYVAFDYVGDRYRAIFGGRYETTDVKSQSFQNVQTAGYNNFLPSAALTYDFTDHLRLRLSFAKALGRANIGDLKIANVANAAGPILTVSGGNPALKPRLSNNLDASLEYYFDEGQSMVSLAVFQKDIKNEIYAITSDIVFDGKPAISTQPQNADSSKVSGLELSVVKNRFDFLPAPFDGLGFSANLTLLKAKTTLRGVGGFARPVDWVFEQPDKIFNTALFYQYGPYETQLTYNYTGKYRTNFAGNAFFQDVVAPYDTLDAQGRYVVNKRLNLTAEVRNIFAERLVKKTGPNEALLQDLSIFGRSIWLGASYKF